MQFQHFKLLVQKINNLYLKAKATINYRLLLKIASLSQIFWK